MEHLAVRGQQDLTDGLTTLNLDSMNGVTVPNDWTITRVMGDIIMAEIIDENEHGEVLRNGLWLKPEITKKMWRVAKIYKIGPKVQDLAVGDLIQYPSDKGLPMIAKNKKKFIFLNQERIFAVVEQDKE